MVILEDGMKRDRGARMPTEMGTLPRCGRYELLAAIGNGSGREVWRAVDPRSQQCVAIKRFAPISRHPLAAHRLHDEVQAIFGAAVEHGGNELVQLLDMGLERDRTWVAAELLEVPTLTDVQADSGLTPKQVADYVVAAAAAVDQLNGRGFVHANLKLSNVFVDVAGEVKLADPFLVEVLGPRLLEEELPESLVSHMAPELVNGAPVSPLSDQYALGVIAYRLLGGAAPFDGVSSLEYLYATVYMEATALSVHMAGLGTEVDRVVRRAMAKAPGDRFADCRSFARQLAAVISARTGERLEPARKAEAPTVRLRPATDTAGWPGPRATESRARDSTGARFPVSGPSPVDEPEDKIELQAVDQDGNVAVPSEERRPVDEDAISEEAADEDLPIAQIRIPTSAPADDTTEFEAAEDPKLPVAGWAIARRRGWWDPGAVWRSISGLLHGSRRHNRSGSAVREDGIDYWRLDSHRSALDTDAAHYYSAPSLDPEWELHVLTDRLGSQVWVNGV